MLQLDKEILEILNEAGEGGGFFSTNSLQDSYTQQLFCRLQSAGVGLGSLSPFPVSSCKQSEQVFYCKWKNFAMTSDFFHIWGSSKDKYMFQK